jgi:TRAP-type C4-dicarboxylate transport system permease large subunit
VCGIIKCRVEDYTKASIPFMIAILLELAILVFIPEAITFIPNMLFGKY